MKIVFNNSTMIISWIIFIIIWVILIDINRIASYVFFSIWVLIELWDIFIEINEEKFDNKHHHKHHKKNHHKHHDH